MVSDLVSTSALCLNVPLSSPVSCTACYFSVCNKISAVNPSILKPQEGLDIVPRRFVARKRAHIEVQENLNSGIFLRT